MGRPFRLDELQFHVGDILSDIQLLAVKGITMLKKDFKHPPKTIYGMELETLSFLELAPMYYNTFWEQVVDEVDTLYRSIGEDYPSVWDDILALLEDESEDATFQPIQQNFIEVKLPCAVREVIDDIRDIDFKYIEDAVENCTKWIHLYVGSLSVREAISMVVDKAWFRLDELSNALDGMRWVSYSRNFSLPTQVVGSTPAYKFPYKISPHLRFNVYDYDLYSKAVKGLYDVWFALAGDSHLRSALTFEEVVTLINSH